tara:strand:- start:2439 stop:2924 length:486 start_codon:yes stop_codon:yes gene_type:complete
MNLKDITFPVFVLSGEAEKQDNILWCTQSDGTMGVVDDYNMKGETIGIRRIQSPFKSLYPLKYMLRDFRSLVKHRGKFYVDTKGKYFVYNKTTKANIIYKRIEKIQKKDVCTLVWVKDIPSPFEEVRPVTAKYAGVLYLQNQPAFIYEFSNELRKKTWRKI